MLSKIQPKPLKTKDGDPRRVAHKFANTTALPKRKEAAERLSHNYEICP